MKRNIVFIVYWLLIPVLVQSQVKEGLYLGENSSGRLLVKADNTAEFFMRYETSVSFKFKCRIITTTDSSFQLENIGEVKDKITQRKKKNRSNEVSVNFYAIDIAGQSSPVSVNYELMSCSDQGSGSKTCICFFYNNRLYCHIVNTRQNDISIYIDAANSFLIKSWKISGDRLIPYINGRMTDKWILRRQHN